jgi:hypothetical protein
MAATIVAFSTSISTSTSLVSIGYTTATGVTAFAVGLNVANTATTNRTAYVDVTRFDGTNNHYIVRQAPIYPGSSISPIRTDNRFAMASGYQIRAAITSTGTPIDCTLSVVEFT